MRTSRHSLIGFLAVLVVLVGASGGRSQQCTAHGDVNCSGGDPTIGDLSWIIDFFEYSQILPPCPVQMDINGDCVVDRWDYRDLLGCINAFHFTCPEVSTCCDPVINYSCCVGKVGDVNGWGWDVPTIGDISSMIEMVFIAGTEVGCVSESDLNQSGGSNPQPDDITVSDISILIDYLFITGASLELADCLIFTGPPQ